MHDVGTKARADVAARKTGVVARRKVGDVGLGGHVLILDARVELELAGRGLVGAEAHGGVGGGAAAEDAESALVVDEVDRVGVA